MHICAVTEALLTEVSRTANLCRHGTLSQCNLHTHGQKVKEFRSRGHAKSSVSFALCYTVVILTHTRVTCS